MKLVHVSDVHIRNLKYHADYRKVFEDLYRHLDKIRPDIVVNTGDMAHTKTQISPEFVEMTSEHIRRVSEYAPYHIILGNHDLNLMNADRQDAITPIVESIRSDRVHLHKKSGKVELNDKNEHAGGWPVNLWVFGIGDQENYPTPADWEFYRRECVNIGLFHGSIRNCVTDSNWRMTHTEHDLSIFNGLDYVLMGDIHKQQFMDRHKRIAYAGSLVQQNFGEDVDKGFLLWDIYDKESHDVSFVPLSGARKFVTIDLNEDKTLPKTSIEPTSRVRVRPKCELSLLEQKAIERQVKKKYGVSDVITLSYANVGSTRSSIGKMKVGHENLRDLVVQEKLIRKFLKSKNLSETVLRRVVDLNRRYHVDLEQRDDSARDVSWRISKIAWSNLFNYGESNLIDFSSISGMTGIFAPNASGKSNMIDVLLQTLFDSTTRGISKNIFLINDNKDQATAVAEIEADGKPYILERTIERVKYGQRSGAAKEWGKTSVNFYAVTPEGVKESLNGTSRPETEREVRKCVGTFDDIMLTGLFAQWNPMDIIQCKETERKRILYRFLDLEIFEHKGELAKKDAREHYDLLKLFEDNLLTESFASLKKQSETISESMAKVEKDLQTARNDIKDIDQEILKHTSQKTKVEAVVDRRAATQNMVKADKDLNDLREKIKLRQAELSASYRELERLTRNVTPVDMEEGKSSSERYAEVSREVDAVSREKDRLVQTVQMNRKKLPLLAEVPCGDSFPQCKFLIDAFSSKTKLPDWEAQLSEVESRLSKLHSEATNLTSKVFEYENELERLEQLRGVESFIENGKLQLENLFLKVKERESVREKAAEELEKHDRNAEDIRKNAMLDTMIAECERAKVGFEKQEAALQLSLNGLIHESGVVAGALQKAEEEMARLNESREICSAYEAYIEAMGKDGIAFDILKQKLPLINEEINKILSAAADFNVHVEHDPAEESIRVYIQYSEYKQRLIELGSGAEKFLSSIAIRNALTSISNLPKTNVFIIDEGFGKLDSKNIENVSRMFDYLRTVFDHIVVISHSDVMKDMVDNMIEITTDDEGYAHVEV